MHNLAHFFFFLYMETTDAHHPNPPPPSLILPKLAPPPPSRTWRHSRRHRWIVVSFSQGMTWHAALRWRDVKDLSLDFTFTEESLGNNI
ncbi:hypothetical protein ABFX02_12G156800 [Erythranthe guttata]